MNKLKLDEGMLELIAAGIHATYALMYESGKTNDPLSITKEEFRTFYKQRQALPNGMPQDKVSQNYHSARKIPEKLAAVGFTIIPMDDNSPADSFTDTELEVISRLEHIRWVKHQIDNGWRYAPLHNTAMKQHDALVAWDEDERKNAEKVYGKRYARKMGRSEGQILSEYYRNLDRVITRSIPWILEIAGFKMLRLIKK